MTYIKREGAIKAVKHLSRNYTGKGKREDHQHVDFIIDEIKYEVPSEDVAPVRHAHWIKISPAGIYECSECGKNVMTSDIGAYEYCHGCGAIMDGDNDE